MVSSSKQELILVFLRIILSFTSCFPCFLWFGSHMHTPLFPTQALMTYLLGHPQGERCGVQFWINTAEDTAHTIHLYGIWPSSSISFSLTYANAVNFYIKMVLMEQFGWLSIIVGGTDNWKTSAWPSKNYALWQRQRQETLIKKEQGGHRSETFARLNFWNTCQSLHLHCEGLMVSHPVLRTAALWRCVSGNSAARRRDTLGMLVN